MLNSEDIICKLYIYLISLNIFNKYIYNKINIIIKL